MNCGIVLLISSSHWYICLYYTNECRRWLDAWAQWRLQDNEGYCCVICSPCLSPSQPTVWNLHPCFQLLTWRLPDAYYSWQLNPFQRYYTTFGEGTFYHCQVSQGILICITWCWHYSLYPSQELILQGIQCTACHTIEQLYWRSKGNSMS